MKKFLLAPVAALAAVVSFASPALADGSVDIPNGVIYPNCTYHQAKYSAADYAWKFSGDVMDPTGGYASFLFFEGAAPGSGTTTGDDGLMFCGGMDRVGTYSITDGEYCYDDYSVCAYFSDTFTMRKAYSRTTLSISDTTAAYGQRITFRATSKAEYKTGYFANKYETVRFQRRIDGVWRTFATASTNTYGAARVTVAWKYRSAKAVRAVTVTTTEYAGSQSAVKTVY